jgi:hypothetical protein
MANRSASSHIIDPGGQAALQLPIDQSQLPGQPLGLVESFFQTQGMLDAGPQLPHAKGLGDVIIGSQGESLRKLILIAATGENDDFQMAIHRSGPKPPAELIAIHVRQVQVE